MLDKFHKSPYLVHPGYQKMITTTRKLYFWLGMKENVVEYIAKCRKCQQVKVEHQHPIGLLQPLDIPKWKYEII